MLRKYNAAGEILDNEPGFAPQSVTFAAYANANGAATTGWRKVPINTKDWDPYNWFDTTNNRWLPKIAGYYRLSAAINFPGAAGITGAALYKNGSLFKQLTAFDPVTGGAHNGGSGTVYLNGVTDYVELFGFTGNSVAIQGSAAYLTHFEGELSAASVGVAAEPWTLINAVGGAAPALQTGWAANASYPAPAFYKDPFGWVHLRGELTTSAGLTQLAWVVPAGYRPAGTTYEMACDYISAGTQVLGLAQVNGSNGNFNLYNNARSTPATGLNFSLASLPGWRAEQ